MGIYLVKDNYNLLISGDLVDIAMVAQEVHAGYITLYHRVSTRLGGREKG